MNSIFNDIYFTNTSKALIKQGVKVCCGLALLGSINGALAVGSSPLTCSVAKSGTWNGGYQLDVTVTNTGTAIKEWTVYLDYAQNAVITSSWNAVLSGSDTRKVTAKNVSFNGNLATGASAKFGLAGSSSAGFTVPSCSVQLNASSSAISVSSSSTASIKSSASASASSKPTQRIDVLNVGFQTQATGTYTLDKVYKDFKGAKVQNGIERSKERSQIVDESGNKILRVNYPANIFGPREGGVQFEVPFVRSYRELYFSYKVRFAQGFDFVLGGKLPGLTGGTAPTGGDDPQGGFSARNMWRTGGVAEQYVYHPQQKEMYGDKIHYMNNGVKQLFTPGKWQTIEHRIVMNTPGKYDGVLQAWVDGVLVLDLHNFFYREKNDNFGIENLYFSTFFGGNGQEWAPLKQQTVDFDNLIVSESPITH